MFGSILRLRLIFLHKQEIITEKMAKNLENMRV